MTAKIKIDGKELEFDGDIGSFLLSMNKNPDSYLFLVDDRPVPMDTIPDNQTVDAIRVASGG